MRSNSAGTAIQDRRPPRVFRQRYPQSTLIRSLLDRRLMGLADRGGSSGYVGDCWGAHCRDWLNAQFGAQIRVNHEIEGTVLSVLDVDGIPGLATFASHRGFQNPDFLIALETNRGERLVIPVDAKFSVETAKPKQVSVEMATALIEAEGSPVAPLLTGGGELRDGFFLSPDYELTHQVLGGAHGILRVTIPRSQVLLLPTAPTVILERDDVGRLALALADVDRYRRETELSLLAALYYVRCAFSAAGSHSDATRPLLGHRNAATTDIDGACNALEDRGKDAYSAWTVVQQWDVDADEIRAIRIAVHQAAEIGISNKDVRAIVELTAKQAGMTAPSVNRVRRELAHWSTGEMVREFGVVYHPVDDLESLLDKLRSHARTLLAEVPGKVREIVLASREL